VKRERRDTRSMCAECGARFSPKGGGHCRGGRFKGCCKTFTSDSSGDKHRVGDYNDGARRCLTTEEMLAKGWRETPRGWTPAPPMSENALARRRGSR